MDLTENESKILAYFARHELFLCFSTIGSDLRLDRNAVRQACRSLVDKKLARYEQTLWDEDGRLAGSGYGISTIGRDYAREHHLTYKEPLTTGI